MLVIFQFIDSSYPKVRVLHKAEITRICVYSSCNHIIYLSGNFIKKCLLIICRLRNQLTHGLANSCFLSQRHCLSLCLHVTTRQRAPTSLCKNTNPVMRPKTSWLFHFPKILLLPLNWEFGQHISRSRIDWILNKKHCKCTRKLSNTDRRVSTHRSWRSVFEYDTKAQETKGKKRVLFHQAESLAYSKGNNHQNQKETYRREKTFAKCMFSKEFTSQIFKPITQLNSPLTMWFKHGQRTWNDIFPKEYIKVTTAYI